MIELSGRDSAGLTRRRVLRGGLGLAFGCATAALIGASGRLARAQGKPAITVYKSPT